jgi:hypothetical protein
MDSKPVPQPGSVYLDELTISAVWTVIRNPRVKKVTVLEEIRPKQRLGRWILEKKGIDVREADFFAGHLQTRDRESVRRASKRLAGEIALAAAKEIIQSNVYLRRLNEKYGRNTIRLFMAKQLQLYVDAWTLRIMVADALNQNDGTELWIKKPSLFKGHLLSTAFPDLRINFYAHGEAMWANDAKIALLDLARDIKLVYGGSRPKLDESLSIPGRHTVLMLQEDHIRFDQALRNQFYWLDVEQRSEIKNIYVVKMLDSRFFQAEDEPRLKQRGITVLPTRAFGTAVRMRKGHHVLQRIRKDRRDSYLNAVHTTPSDRFFVLKVAMLLRQAELMGAMALWLNVRVFLIKETHSSFADAMQLVAPDIGVTTVACQYSNLPFISPMMMSTADKVLLFSDMYKALYQVNDISPIEFQSTGYLYDGIAPRIRLKARRHREKLASAGAEFVVCYFDESVETVRWGGISKNDHKAEVHALAAAVLADPTLGVVIKPQFTRNSPSRLYPDDEIIQSAKATGRYLELVEGAHRNDIYPLEAALVSDLCIGHKLGATAALEAAVAGHRTILLDEFGTITLCDKLYAQADIEYKTVARLMEAVTGYRAAQPVCRNLGDWSPIIHHFDSHRDGKAIERLRELISQALEESGKVDSRLGFTEPAQTERIGKIVND